MSGTRMHVKPDCVELIEGSGYGFSLFGCSFVIVGSFVLMFGMLSAGHTEHHSFFERVVAGGLGLAFVLAGAFFAFGRNGIVVDRSDGVIRKWNGLYFFRFVTDTFPLSDFSRFAIEQPGPNSFLVVVEGGNNTVTLTSSNSYSVARERAEKIAVIVPLECDDEVQKLDSNRRD